MTKSIAVKYSQNFIRSAVLVDKLLAKSGIRSTDLVIEIGAGEGMITKALGQQAAKVIAFELDPRLFQALQEQNLAGNISLVPMDFLKADLARYAPFKVFANIPFFHTADIMQKLLLEEHELKAAYLFMQQEAAYRFMGAPFAREGIIPLLIKPFWDLKIGHNFNSRDFKPEPDARVVLLDIIRKIKPDVSPADRHLYFDFVCYLINQRKAQIKNALLDLFTYNQLRIMAREQKLDLTSKPTDLVYSQWLKLFSSFLQHCPESKRSVLTGSYAKLQRHQHKLNRGKKVVLSQDPAATI